MNGSLEEQVLKRQKTNKLAVEQESLQPTPSPFLMPPKANHVNPASQHVPTVAVNVNPPENVSEASEDEQEVHVFPWADPIGHTVYKVLVNDLIETRKTTETAHPIYQLEVEKDDDTLPRLPDAIVEGDDARIMLDGPSKNKAKQGVENDHGHIEQLIGQIAKSLGKALVKVEESWNVHLGATTNIMDSLAGEIDQINRDKNAVRNETFETYKTLESLRPPATLPTW